MRKSTKNLTSIRSCLRGMEDAGILEPGQTEALSKAVKLLDHALRVRHVRQVHAAVNELARLFVRLRLS